MQLMVAVQMGEELLLDLILKDVVLSMLKIAPHRTLGVAQMAFLQVCDQYIETAIHIHIQAKIYGNEFFIGYGHFNRIKSH
jgi:hypothetical protein